MVPFSIWTKKRCNRRLPTTRGRPATWTEVDAITSHDDSENVRGKSPGFFDIDFAIRERS